MKYFYLTQLKFPEKGFSDIQTRSAQLATGTRTEMDTKIYTMLHDRDTRLMIKPEKNQREAKHEIYAMQA